MISQIRYAAIAAAAILALTGCKEEGTNATTGDGPRSVRTVVAEPAAPVRTRAFPAVLEPPEITPLAFDVGGRLGALDLRIGETVAAGTVLATVEAGDAELRTSQARSSVVEAQAAATNAREEADRQEQLLARAVVSQAARDSAVTQAEQAEARLEQARRNLELVEESLDDTALVAPFDAVVNSIEVQAFGSVQAGQPVVTLYEEGGLQAQIAVSYAVVSGLTLGQEVVVVPTDGDARPLAARISEIAQRAPAVASFPVIVTLEETRDDLRSGMAVEVEVDLPVPEGLRGIPLPLSALALQLPAQIATLPREASVFVWRGTGDAGNVEPVTVTIAAVAEDEIFVSDGLSPGDRVVTAGVSFLVPGQAARLEEGR